MNRHRSNQVALRSLARGVPQFYFNLYDDMIAMDEEGAELPDLEVARTKAMSSAREIACAEVLEGHLNLAHRIEVTDNSGTILITVHFNDAVEIKP